MNTPICDFVKEYGKSGKVRAHMPGHKGIGDMELYDITEIPGADSLYEAKGIIKESQQNAGALFGADTFFSAEGSSLSIRAMLYLAAAYGKSRGREPIIIAARNVHKSFVTAAALLDLQVEWLYPEEQECYLSCRVSPCVLEEKIKKYHPVAVYITSPDYLGNMQDIKGIGEVCKRNNVLLLVDNAHGAYLKFLPESAHPMDLGAHMCADSAHKTLPVLTGGAYLHINKDAPAFFKENAKAALSLFGSTSPSYLILQSLDRANTYLETHKRRLSGFLPKIQGLKNALSGFGYTLIGDEPLKITLSTKPYGYKGFVLAQLLEEKGIVCEFSDSDHLVLMLTQENSGDIEKIIKAFAGVKKLPEIKEAPLTFEIPQKALSIRTAIFGDSEILPVGESLGKVVADVSVGCPPAVPVIISGEVVDATAIECFKYYGIKEIKVLKG